MKIIVISSRIKLPFLGKISNKSKFECPSFYNYSSYANFPIKLYLYSKEMNAKGLLCKLQN